MTQLPGRDRLNRSLQHGKSRVVALDGGASDPWKRSMVVLKALDFVEKVPSSGTYVRVRLHKSSRSIDSYT